MRSHFLLQGIVPTQGSNPSLLHCRQTTYHLSYLGNPTEPYSKGRVCEPRGQAEGARDLILVDQECWRDRATGEYFPIDNRMWLINTSATRFEPLVPGMFYGRDDTEMAHDYFSGDGYVCWSDYLYGAYECDLETRKLLLVWKRPIIHSHCSKHREYFVGDITPYEWKTKGCDVIFYDRKTEKEINIFTNLPFPENQGRYYHLDPHPQFCAEDTLIVCESTALTGEPMVSVTFVCDCIEKCREKGETVIPHHDVADSESGWRKEIQMFDFG